MFTFGFNVKPKKAGGVSYDADASAFFTAASITDTTQKSAVNQLVLDLKSYNIWDKMKALYPIVGGSAGSHAVNLKTPGTYNLTFSTGWTHASTGMTPASAYADTGLNENTILSNNNEHFSIYSRTNNDGLYCDIGLAFSATIESNIFAKYNNLFYPRNQATNNGTTNTVSSLGLFVSNRVSSSEIRAFQNGTLKQLTIAFQGKTNQTFYIGAMNRIAGNLATGFYSNRQYAFASIGDGLDDTEAANFYTAVQAYQTTLSRNV